jgi:homoserine trans-succinylase
MVPFFAGPETNRGKFCCSRLTLMSTDDSTRQCSIGAPWDISVLYMTIKTYQIDPSMDVSMFIATYDQGICLSDLRYTSDRHGGINTQIPEDVFVNTDKDKTHRCAWKRK